MGLCGTGEGKPASVVRLLCPGLKEEAEVRSRSVPRSLRGWAGSAEARRLLGTSRVFSSSAAWAGKGGAFQGSGERGK